MPTCAKCGKFISASHYERHLKRCGVVREKEPSHLGESVTARLESEERGTELVHPIVEKQAAAQAGGTDYSPPDEEPRGTNWTKVAAYFVIFLLIGSTVVFFLLYFLSVL